MAHYPEMHSKSYLKNATRKTNKHVRQTPSIIICYIFSLMQGHNKYL
uniref:Uncharacterized protein n=1 Tax=Rhizophora mucronata TaxID=61149 RepID=A0A2P2LTM4_RHIMU